MGIKSLINGLLCGLVSPGQLKAREATMYSYNGVVLPKLPEWDRETYPYAVIYYHYTDFGVVAEYTELLCSKSPFVGDSSYLSSKPTDAYISSYINHLKGETEWSEVTEYDAFNGTYVSTASGTVSIWANHDVYDSTDDTTVYLCASEPVPTYEEQAATVMYSYNGTELPQLPEWDRETYPYAVLYNSEYLICFAIPWQVVEVTTTVGGNTFTSQKLKPNDGETTSHIVYYRPENCTSGVDWYYRRTTYSSISPSGLIWSNFDILNEDGTIYLSASEPIPVYE